MPRITLHLVFLLTGASEINCVPENWTDQPLYFRSKGSVSFTSFSTPSSPPVAASLCRSVCVVSFVCFLCN
ncbi:hypothetical protein K438DRAFT_805730 [Mycena galopus ATCC 62051]|nr:hypothetical protein K438DRAFT_805730 [Mycena galopus ATCC 62051]